MYKDAFYFLIQYTFETKLKFMIVESSTNTSKMLPRYIQPQQSTPTHIDNGMSQSFGLHSGRTPGTQL